MRALFLTIAATALLVKPQVGTAQPQPPSCSSLASLLQPCTFDTGINSDGKKTYTIRGYQVVNHTANGPKTGVIQVPILGLDADHVHVTVFIANSSGNGVEVKSATADNSGRIAYEIVVPRGARINKLSYILSVATKEDHPLVKTVRTIEQQRLNGTWVKACYLGADTAAPLIFPRDPGVFYNYTGTSNHARESECAGGRNGTGTYLLACVSFTTTKPDNGNNQANVLDNRRGLLPSIIVAAQPIRNNVKGDNHGFPLGVEGSNPCGWIW